MQFRYTDKCTDNLQSGGAREACRSKVLTVLADKQGCRSEHYIRRIPDATCCSDTTKSPPCRVNAKQHSLKQRRLCAFTRPALGTRVNLFPRHTCCMRLDTLLFARPGTAVGRCIHNSFSCTAFRLDLFEYSGRSKPWNLHRIVWRQCTRISSQRCWDGAVFLGIDPTGNVEQHANFLHRVFVTPLLFIVVVKNFEFFFAYSTGCIFLDGAGHLALGEREGRSKAFLGPRANSILGVEDRTASLLISRSSIRQLNPHVGVVVPATRSCDWLVALCPQTEQSVLVLVQVALCTGRKPYSRVGTLQRQGVVQRVNNSRNLLLQVLVHEFDLGNVSARFGPCCGVASTNGRTAGIAGWCGACVCVARGRGWVATTQETVGVQRVDERRGRHECIARGAWPARVHDTRRVPSEPRSLPPASAPRHIVPNSGVGGLEHIWAVVCSGWPTTTWHRAPCFHMWRWTSLVCIVVGSTGWSAPVQFVVMWHPQPVVVL
eukprot:m.746738 g.746738  ORF g.746738 m.746738 type:complete len:489 (-) comp23140_c0_seq3:1486-2952(-)